MQSRRKPGNREEGAAADLNGGKNQILRITTADPTNSPKTHGWLPHLRSRMLGRNQRAISRAYKQFVNEGESQRPGLRVQEGQIPYFPGSIGLIQGKSGESKYKWKRLQPCTSNLRTYADQESCSFQALVQLLSPSQAAGG